MKRLLPLLLLMLAGCESTPRPAYNEDGLEAYFVECSTEYPGFMVMTKTCHQKSEEICGGAYAIDDKSTSSTSGGTNPYTGVYSYGSTSHTWKVVCQ